MIAVEVDAIWPCGVSSAGFMFPPNAALRSAMTPVRMSCSFGRIYPSGPNVGSGTEDVPAILGARLRRSAGREPGLHAGLAVLGERHLGGSDLRGHLALDAEIARRVERRVRGVDHQVVGRLDFDPR